MRLPASPTAHPPEPVEAAIESAVPTGIEAQPQPAASPKPRWRRAAHALSSGAFLSVASVLVVVSGAFYVGLAHAPWVDRLVSRTPVVAEDATGVAMTAVSDGTSAATATDAVVAARNRMASRVYSQAQPDAAVRTVAQSGMVDADRVSPEDNGGSAPRPHRRAVRHVRHVSHGNPWDSRWYVGG